MRYIILYLFLTITNYVCPDSETFSVEKIFSFLEENFQIDQLYSRSQLLMSDSSIRDAKMVWDLLDLKSYSKGFRGRNERSEPQLHFLKANADNHRIKCYLNNNSFRSCEIIFSRSVVGNEDNIIAKLENFNLMISQLEVCHNNLGNIKIKSFISSLCKTRKGAVGLEVSYRPGKSKRVRFELKLSPRF